MPYINSWHHFVWATKNREPLLTREIRPLVFNHIKENAASKGIHLKTVNGFVEHVHCLISLTAEQNIASIANLLKGESSHWINKQKLMNVHFGWQDDYFAVSVSNSLLEKVEHYIQNQESHHAKQSFAAEYALFMAKYGFE